ncbi:MAG: serine hydrolase, partial [Bacteroidetes bacterium]|nr:serine hydrolase [Bacteroidota bacterium]
MRQKSQWIYLILLVFFISGIGTIRAQNPSSGSPNRWRVPNSPMGKQISAFMDALDSKELSQIQKYVTEYYAPDVINKFGVDKLAKQLKQYADEFDDLQIIGLMRGDEKSVTITVLSEKNRVEKSFILTISDASSDKIAEISVKEKEALPFTDFKKLHKYLKRQTKKGDFSGAVLVSVKGKTKFEKAYGLASKRFNIPNNTKTKFNIGSLNKLFTATAILQLYEQGLLKLDDPLSKYSTQFPQEIADKVTIRHLLKHQSGWSSYWDNEYFIAHYTGLKTIDEYISFLKDVPLEFEPGSQTHYSNTGYVILGAIIEKITGESYFDYVRANIYNKADMEDTDSYEMDMPIPNLAIGYTKIEGSDKSDFKWESIPVTYSVINCNTEQENRLKKAEERIEEVIIKLALPQDLLQWNKEILKKISTELRKITKPMIIACNKIDVPGAKENFTRLQKEFPDHLLIPCSAESELALKEAAKHGI